tara:strand:- start:81 stop:350 length:270 start_codon:yes stop_codon:yes gene_type:complete
MDFSPVSMCLNMLMGEFKENTSLEGAIEKFPDALVYEAWIAGKANFESVKKGHENLLERTLTAMEIHLGIDLSVIQCSQEGVDIMEDLA